MLVFSKGDDNFLPLQKYFSKDVQGPDNILRNGLHEKSANK